MTPIETFALAYFALTPLLERVVGFEVNELPNTVSLVYKGNPDIKIHRAFPKIEEGFCKTMDIPRKGEAIIAYKGPIVIPGVNVPTKSVETDYCYRLKVDDMYHEGTPVEGTYRAYQRNRIWYSVVDYKWELRDPLKPYK